MITQSQITFELVEVGPEYKDNNIFTIFMCLQKEKHLPHKLLLFLMNTLDWRTIGHSHWLRDSLGFSTQVYIYIYTYTR